MLNYDAKYNIKRDIIQSRSCITENKDGKRGDKTDAEKIRKDTKTDSGRDRHYPAGIQCKDQWGYESLQFENDRRGGRIPDRDITGLYRIAQRRDRAVIIGYARVSTEKQVSGTSLKDQEDALRNAGAVEIYSDAFTGTTMERPNFELVLSKLRAGDTLCITKLDRIARTETEGYQTIKSLMDKGISVHVLNMGLIDDTPTGRLILHIMLSFAEFERDMIYERTQAGREYKRKNDPDYKEGRKPIDKEVIEKIRLGWHYSELGISRATWTRYRRKLKEDKKASRKDD